MPTNRKRTSRGRRGAPIDADEWAILNDETPVNPFVALIRPDAHWRQLWVQYGEEITEKWAQKYPGTRPKYWWKFSAPRRRAPETAEGSVDRSFPEPRLQVSGPPVDDDPYFCSIKAIPSWDDDDPDFISSPPVFESERAYLKRHGLLLPGEASRFR